MSVCQLYSKQMHVYNLVHRNVSSNSSTCIKTTKTLLVDSPTCNMVSKHFILSVIWWFNKVPLCSREVTPYGIDNLNHDQRKEMSTKNELYVNPTSFFVRAVYDYRSDDPSALQIVRGDVIEVLTVLESGWWDGLIGEERGWFPSNYAIKISKAEAKAALGVLWPGDYSEDEASGSDDEPVAPETGSMKSQKSAASRGSDAGKMTTVSF